MIRIYKVIILLLVGLFSLGVNYSFLIVPLALMFYCGLNRDGIQYIPFEGLLLLFLVLFIFKYFFSWCVAKLILKCKKMEFLKKIIFDKKFYKLMLQILMLLDESLFLYLCFYKGFFSALIIMLFVSTTLTYLPFYLTMKKEFKK